MDVLCGGCPRWVVRQGQPEVTITIDLEYLPTHIDIDIDIDTRKEIKSKRYLHSR